MQVNQKTKANKAATATHVQVTETNARSEIQTASLSQKEKLGKVFKALGHALAGGNITTKNEGLRKEVGNLATNTSSLSTKKTEINTSIDKAVTGLAKVKSLFEKNILGALIKNIAKNIDAIMKNSVCQSIVKSLLMTKTRVTPEDIVKKTDSQAQKTEWLSTIKNMDILRDDQKSLRITPENLDKIQTRLSDLEAQVSSEPSETNTKIGSEIKLCKILIKTYEDRLAIKEALKTDKAGIIEGSSKLAAVVLSTLEGTDFSSPEKLLKKIIHSCKENPELREQMQSMISDKENPLHKLIVSVAGENAIHGLNIATAPEGLAIADALISAGSVDIAKSFLENPVGTLLDNKDLLMTTASNAFDAFVTLLDNKSATDSMLALSDGRLQPADIDLLKNILPLAKGVISELNATESPTERPSKTAMLMSKIAGHVAARCDLELANIHTASTSQTALPISDTIDQLTTGLDNSLSLLTKLTVGLAETPKGPDATSLQSTDSPKAETPIDQSWGGWVSSWGSSVVSGVANVAQFGSNMAVHAVASTLGDEAGLYLESSIENASEIISDTTTYISDSVRSAATTIGNIPSNIVSAAVNLGIEAASTTAAGKIDSKIDKTLTAPLSKTDTPKKATSEITLNHEKLTEFMAQSVSLLSHFIAENPAVLDSVGSSVTTLLVSVADILQNPETDTAERAKSLCNTLKESLGEIGQAIVSSNGATAAKVGNTLINAGALLGSALVERSLAKSTALTQETITKAGQFGELKIRQLVLDKATNTLSSINAPKVALPKEEKSMKIPQKVATALGTYSSTDLGATGGVLGRIVNFVGLGAAKGGLDIASQIIQVK